MEHTIIITALLRLRKSNIHVGEYRPQHKHSQKNKRKNKKLKKQLLKFLILLKNELLRYKKTVKKRKIRSTQSSSLLCSDSRSQIFTSVNTGHSKP